MRAIRALMLHRDMSWHWLALLLVCASLAAPRIAFAQQDELPGRVGRISDVAGELFLAPEDRASDWSPAGLNYPVTTGDNLWVGLDGRAEVDFGAGQFRMAGETNVHVSRLDDQVFGLFVAQGRVNVRIRALENGEVARIDTPNTQITLTRPGSYKVEVAPDRQHTVLVVREGEALAQVSAGLQQVLPGQTAAVVGTDSVYAEVRNGFAQDGFDAWASDRDRRYERNRSTAYVSRQMVGYADLDEYGTWQTTPDYGAVWFPTAVGADWAPYRNGYWTSVGAWGATWVDAAPWGYAPSHYGRWAFVGGRWGWCPGSYVARPVWAPALVGWVGGSRWNVSVSAGGPVYGWVPLGWGEPYRPSWNNCGSRCWNNYNRPYAVNVQERPAAPPPRYINANMPGGTTAVSGAVFNGRKPVPTNLVALTGTATSVAPVLNTAPVIARPAPAEINAVRPGQRGTPPPASTLYANSKPAPYVVPAASAPNSGRPLPHAAMPAEQGTPTYARPARNADKPAPGYGAPAAAPMVVPQQSYAPQPNARTPAQAPVAAVAPQAPVIVAPQAAQNAPPPGYAKPAQNERPVASPRQEMKPQVRELPATNAAPTYAAPMARPQPSAGVAMPAPQPMAAPVARPMPVPAVAPAVAPVPGAVPAPAAHNGGNKPAAQEVQSNRKAPADANAPGAVKDK